MRSPFVDIMLQVERFVSMATGMFLLVFMTSICPKIIERLIADLLTNLTSKRLERELLAGLSLFLPILLLCSGDASFPPLLVIHFIMTETLQLDPGVFARTLVLCMCVKLLMPKTRTAL